MSLQRNTHAHNHRNWMQIPLSPLAFGKITNKLNVFFLELSFSIFTNSIDIISSEQSILVFGDSVRYSFAHKNDKLTTFSPITSSYSVRFFYDRFLWFRKFLKQIMDGKRGKKK